MWLDSPRHGPSGICAIAGLNNLLPQPFCKCPSPQTLLGISQKVSRFTLVPKMWLICIIILVWPLSLSIARLRATCLCGLPTLEYHASLWSSLLRLTLDGPCVVSFSRWKQVLKLFAIFSHKSIYFKKTCINTSQ